MESYLDENTWIRNTLRALTHKFSLKEVLRTGALASILAVLQRSAPQESTLRVDIAVEATVS